MPLRTWRQPRYWRFRITNLPMPARPELLHRAHEQRVRPLGSLLRPDEIRVREEGRVDLLVRHEVLEVDRVLALDLHGLEVLVGELDELALRVLERLDDLVVRHRLLLDLADLLVADRRVVLRVDQVEAAACARARRVKMRTGTLTSPNEIEPVHSDRGMRVFSATSEGSPRSHGSKHLQASAST